VPDRPVHLDRAVGRRAHRCDGAHPFAALLEKDLGSDQASSTRTGGSGVVGIRRISQPGRTATRSGLDHVEISMMIGRG